MKNRIIAVTPNPALDISGIVDSIKINEKTYVYKEERAPGGNAINVARILHRLKVPVLSSGFLGGSTGDEVASLLANEDISQRFIRTRQSTRINITVSNRSDKGQTRLSFSGPRIKPSEVNKLLGFVKKNHGKMLVIGGSLPPQFNIENLNRLIEVACKKNMEVVVDCPGSVLRKMKASQLLLIKPNLEEFQSMTRSRVRSISDVKKKALRFLKLTSFICISSVEGGALLVSRAGCYFGRIPPVKIRSTVGAGDSMVGAMVAQFYRGQRSPDEILRWGLAASAATLSETGTKLGQAEKIEKLYRKTVVKEV